MKKILSIILGVYLFTSLALPAKSEGETIPLYSVQMGFTGFFVLYPTLDIRLAAKIPGRENFEIFGAAYFVPALMNGWTDPLKFQFYYEGGVNYYMPLNDTIVPHVGVSVFCISSEGNYSIFPALIAGSDFLVHPNFVISPNLTLAIIYNEPYIMPFPVLTLNLNGKYSF